MSKIALYIDSQAESNEFLDQFREEHSGQYNFIERPFKQEDDFFLTCIQDRVSFVKGKQNPIFIDWTNESLLKRFAKTSSREPFIRALIAQKDKPKTLYDMTAGLGTDAFIASKYFSELFLVEANPLVHLLLQDGLRRALENERSQRFTKKVTLVNALAQDFLQGLKSESSKDLSQSVFYFDFMFEAKSSQSNKEMDLLKALSLYDPRLNSQKGRAISLAQDLQPLKTVMKAKSLPQDLDLSPIYEFKGKVVNYYRF